MMRSIATLAWAALSLSLATCGAHAGGNNETRIPRSTRIEFTPELVLTSPGVKPRVLDPKRGYVAKGDTIEAFITPQEDAFVYLGYCHDNEFKLYPEAGRVLRAEARYKFKIPEPYDIDDDRVLYVIVSRAEVSLASPDLAIVIAHDRQVMGRRAMESDCTGGPGDGTSSHTPSVTPIDVRASGSAIKVVRYELLRRP